MILQGVLLYLYVGSDVWKLLFQCILEFVFTLPTMTSDSHEADIFSLSSCDLTNIYSNICGGDEILQSRIF